MCGFLQSPQLIGKLMKVQKKVTQTLINPLSTLQDIMSWINLLRRKTEQNLREFTQFYLIYEADLKNSR